MNKRAVGSRYETMAAAHLEEKGYKILERNFRCRMGEVDLVALCEQGSGTDPEKTITTALVLDQEATSELYSCPIIEKFFFPEEAE